MLRSIGDAFPQSLDESDFPPFAPASAYESEVQGSSAEQPGEFIPLDLAVLAQRRARAKEMAIERLAPAGEVTKVDAPGGTGKSSYARNSQLQPRQESIA
jgi:hypothetical protein